MTKITMIRRFNQIHILHKLLLLAVISKWLKGSLITQNVLLNLQDAQKKNTNLRHTRDRDGDRDGDGDGDIYGVR